MKFTRLVTLALCLTLCLPGFAEKKKKKEVVEEGPSPSSKVLYMNEGYKHEIMLNGSTQSFPISPGVSGGNLAFGSGTTYLNFSGGYNYDVIPILQLGIFPSISYVSGGGLSATMFSLIAGPTINLSLDGDIQNAFFISGAAGLTVLASTAEFTFRFDLGKRFRLFDHFSYEPSFGVLKVSGYSALFVFNLLGASVHF